MEGGPHGEPFARRRVVHQVVGIDLQRPGKVRRPPVQLLVEVVPPTTDRLCEGNGGRGARGRRRVGNALLLRHVQADRCAEQQTTRDSQTALPQLRDVRVVVRETVPVGGDVIQPSADHTGDDSPDRHRTGVVGRARAPLLEPLAEQPDARDHPSRDHQPVDIEAEWPNVEGVERRAGNGRHDGHDQLVTRSMNARLRSLIRSRSKSCVATW